MGLTQNRKYPARSLVDDPRFDGVDMAADWIRDLESSDSRLHKERVIEKALMSARLGSASAQGFLFNCYLALNDRSLILAIAAGCAS